MALDIAPFKPSRTAKYTLYNLGAPGAPDIVLEVRDAMTDSAPFRAALRKNIESMRAMTPNDASRLEAKLLAKHVIVGWENVTEAGVAVAYSPERGEELLLHILEADLWQHYIIPLGLFVREPSNFCDPLPKAADLGNE